MSDSRTRWAVERERRPRPFAANERTACIETPPPGETLAFDQVVHRHYTRIRQLCTAPAAPGLVIIAADSAGVAATAYLAAKPDSINVAIVGRHTSCDVYLADAALSLRHLAVVLYPLAAGQPTRFRMIDLRSRSGLADEHNRPRHALEADGPMFAQAGQRLFLCFPVGEGYEEARWPQSSTTAWQGLPERVHLAVEPASGPPPASPSWHDEASSSPSMTWGTGPAATLLRALPPPQRPQRRIGGRDEPLAGWLEIIEGDCSRRIDVGEGAAAHGLLLGRYNRCDTNGLQALQGKPVSRVHALLLRIVGATYLIDTASRNGVWVDGQRVRYLRLKDGVKVALPDKRHVLRWHDVN